MSDKTMIERIWKRAVRKRVAEETRAQDELLARADSAHACTVEHGGTMCGAPLDVDGICEVHE